MWSPLPRAEIAQSTIDRWALDHVGDRQTTLLVERYIFDAGVFGGRQIGGRGIATIGSNLTRHRAVVRLMAFKHRHEALTVRRIAGFDDRIEDESAAPRDQVEFVTVLNLTPTLDDDVGVRLEQAHYLLASRHHLAIEHASFSLRDHLQNKRFVMPNLR